MAFWDRFTKKKKTKGKRNFYGSNTGRLYGDWNSSNSSPDGELQNSLVLLRDRYLSEFFSQKQLNEMTEPEMLKKLEELLELKQI